MTQEEKAQAYDKAVERAEKALEVLGTDKCEGARQIFSLFPELKESEDERIRKEIISALKYANHKGVYDKHLAWLEKQGDKPFDYENANIQQKDFAPKQEPKFKVGDFIVNDYCMGKVIALTDDAYLLDSGQGIPFSCEHNAHLWSIQDAKDGDVLNSPTHHLIWIYKDNEHYHACVNMNYVTENVATDGLISIPNDACPATKDEQTILFARMKETGYEWDAKKLELKKVEQNPAWSRDDEKVYLSIMSVLLSTIGTDKNGFTVTREVNWLKSLKERVQSLSQPKGWSEEDKRMHQYVVNDLRFVKELVNDPNYAVTVEKVEDEINWLKSLKERMQPQQKPTWSEEDSVRLQRIIDFLWYNRKGDTDTIYQQEQDIDWLKSLKQRIAK